jgi:hypothetical protein
MSYYERMKKGHLMMIENNRMMKSLLINMVDNYDNFLNSLNEITEETETRDIGVNTDYIDDNDDDSFCKYIRHIVKNDGIAINGELHKWKKYNNEYTSRIDFKDLYDDYKKYTNGSNGILWDYDDDFIVAITHTYEGVDKIWDGKHHKYRMSFNKKLVEYIIGVSRV